MSFKNRFGKNVNLIYFSWTGNTRRVFSKIRGELEARDFSVRLHEIKPKRNFPYIVWLLLSFIPGLKVKTNPVSITSDIIILGTPKWTLNCPPITYFIENSDLKGKRIFVVITFGGFDEKRYAESLARKIKSKGAEIRSILLIKRKKIEGGEYEKIVREWVDELINMIN